MVGYLGRNQSINQSINQSLFVLCFALQATLSFCIRYAFFCGVEGRAYYTSHLSTVSGPWTGEVERAKVRSGTVPVATMQAE